MRLAEAITERWHDSFESGASGRTLYSCHFCGGVGVPQMHEFEHDSDCVVLLANTVLKGQYED